MKQILIVTIGLLIQLQAKCQELQIKYYNLVNYGEYLKYIGDYSNSKRIYEKAFKLGAHMQGKDFLAAASVSFRLGEKEHAFNYFHIASKYPIGFNDLIIKQDSVLYNELTKDDSLRKVFDLAIQQNLKIRATFMDSTFIRKNREIRIWVDSDQYYTTNRIQYDKLPIDDSFRKLAQFEDSMFYERYYQYIIENGYPGFWVTNTDEISLLNLHIFYGEQSIRFKKLLFEEYIKGNMLTSEFVYFLDRHEYLQNSECGLGIYTSKFCDLKKDWKKLAENRLKYGMSIFLKEPRRIFNREMNLSLIVNYMDINQLKKWF